MLVSEILATGTDPPTVIVHSNNAKGHRRVLRNGYGDLMTVKSLNLQRRIILCNAVGGSYL